MCEKAARIAELEREIAEGEQFIADIELDGFSPAVGTATSMANLRAELSRLRKETPALTQGKGSEPVGWRYRYKNESGAVWGYTDSESVAASYEAPVYEVEPLYASLPPLPAGTDPLGLRPGLQKAIQIAEALIVSPWDKGAEKTKRIIAGALRGIWDNPNRRGITEAPAPSPAGNADPRVREAFEAWERKRYVTALDRNPKGTWGDEAGEKYAAPFVQASWEAWQAAIPSPQGLVEAADICRELYQTNFPSASPSELLLLTEAERLIRSRASGRST